MVDDVLSIKADWQSVASVDDLRPGQRLLVKIDGRQILLMNVDGALYALNNRCPHEGFPLMEGSVDHNCHLTCNWHGWRFDLKDGKAVQGRDPVRTYPVERRGDQIYVDLTPLDREVAQRRAKQELLEALEDFDPERMARGLLRFEKAGGDPYQVIQMALDWSAPQLEVGLTHAQAGLADWLWLGETVDLPDAKGLALIEALDQFSQDVRYDRDLPYSCDKMPYDSPQFRSALEKGDESKVQAMLLGALAYAVPASQILTDIEAIIYRHYLGFGHGAIYLEKIRELIAKLGHGCEAPLLKGLARYVCFASREDLIPEFRQFARYLDQVPGNAEPLSPSAISGLSVNQALAVTAASSGKTLETWEVLLAASALNLLRFDTDELFRIDQPISHNMNWLDFTHAITFADALYQSAQSNPSLWHSGLLQIAMFIGRNKRGLLPEPELETWQVKDEKGYMDESLKACFSMHNGLPIHRVHRLKLACAVQRLSTRVSKETRALLFAALHRYLEGISAERNPLRSWVQAKSLVERE